MWQSKVFGDSFLLLANMAYTMLSGNTAGDEELIALAVISVKQAARTTAPGTSGIS